MTRPLFRDEDDEPEQFGQWIPPPREKRRANVWAPPCPEGRWWEQARFWRWPHVFDTCVCGIQFGAMSPSVLVVTIRSHKEKCPKGDAHVRNR